nr:MAG TPA: hypothetical protein [Bacteriophage sp.]
MGRPLTHVLSPSKSNTSKLVLFSTLEVKNMNELNLTLIILLLLIHEINKR